MNYFEQTVAPGTVMHAAAIRPAPGMLDVTGFVTDGLVAPLLRGLGQAAVNVAESMGGLTARRTRADHDRPPKHECGCEGENPCHCTCCIVDADVVIYTYLGERRIFTFIVENERRREKDVQLALGSFTTRAGKPASIKGELLSPTEFKLAPCASHTAIMVIDTAPGATPVVERIPDVEECTVYYADLKVEGCEIRPLRIAVAILPRDCGAYKVHCHNCCC